MKTHVALGLMGAVASTAGLLLPMTVHAAADNSSTEGAKAGLEEVIVTARKREERLLDVPVAVSAFTADAIEQRGAPNIGSFLQEAPGVNLYDRGNGFKVTIRGISTSLGANENGYYLDDLPFTGVTVPLNPDVRAWDLERVEVLRGPQGTLFGEGSMGGTIRIITRDAQFNEWQASASVSGSDTKGGGDNIGLNTGIKGMVNVPLLDDKLALRLTGTRERFDGWNDEPNGGAKDVNTTEISTYRARLRFQPVEQLSINAMYWHFNADYPRDSSATDDGHVGTGTVLASGTEYDLFGLSASYDFGPASLFYSFSHNDFSLPQVGSLFGGELSAGIDIKVKSHELRAASSGEGPWQWTVGAYQRDANREDNFLFPLFGLDNVDATDTRSQALFSEVTYSFPNAPFDLTGGLRYVREKIGGFEANSGVATADQGKTYTSVNPRAIIAWRPNDDWRVYLSAAKGYRSGQLQPTVSLALAEPLGISLPAALGDDSIWSYELGTKANLLDGRMVLEAAVYHSDWKDVTVRIPLGTSGFNGLINSKGTKTNGVEANVNLRLTEAWTVNVNGSYADAKYAGAVPGTGIADGRPVDDVAKTTASASLMYERPAFNTLTGSARLGVQYNSKRDFASFGPPLYYPGDAITAVDFRTGLEAEHWGAFLFVDNLTDENGATSPRTWDSSTNEITASRLRPRTVGIEIRMDFK